MDRDELTVAYMLGYEDGRKRRAKELHEFYLWLRENGDKYTDINDMIKKYLEG